MYAEREEGSGGYPMVDGKCTDDDLKLLKEEADYWEYRESPVEISCSDLKALLARLEASEKMIPLHHDTEAWERAYEKWMEIAGKANG